MRLLLLLLPFVGRHNGIFSVLMKDLDAERAE